MKKQALLTALAAAISITADDCFQQPTCSKNSVDCKAAYYDTSFSNVYPANTALVAWRGLWKRDVFIAKQGWLKDDPATLINEDGQYIVFDAFISRDIYAASGTLTIDRCPLPNSEWSRFKKIEIFLRTFPPGTSINWTTPPVEWAKVIILD